jgi:hypothetical protein
MPPSQPRNNCFFIFQSWCQCYKTFYCGNLLPFQGNTLILCYKMILLWYQILPWYFNLRKSRYCSKLPWYFYNTGQKYHGILTLEKGGTTVNYRGIFITLAPSGRIQTLDLRRNQVFCHCATTPGHLCS